MKYVDLGGRRVSAIGLGTWQFGSAEWGWGRDFGPDEARGIVHHALDVGINFFDTAEIYGFGRSETVLGEALRGLGDDVVVATKVWPMHITPRAVVGAAHASLRRLGREAIDLYQVHWPNPLVPLAWTMGGMRRLLEDGLVRQVGVSNYGLQRWLRAEPVLGGAVVSNQVGYHLLRRQAEKDLIPYAATSGRTIVAYSPLAQGLLGGAFAPGYRAEGVRAMNPLFQSENLRRAQPVIEALRDVAADRGATPAQIALAWTLRHGCVVAIPGARRVAQVEENAAAADIDLSEEEIERLDQAAAMFRTVGLVRSTLGRLLGR